MKRRRVWAVEWHGKKFFFSSSAKRVGKGMLVIIWRNSDKVPSLSFAKEKWNWNPRPEFLITLSVLEFD